MPRPPESSVVVAAGQVVVRKGDPGRPLLARTEATVFALERADFLAAVVGNAGFGRDPARVAAARLETSVQSALAAAPAGP